MHRALYLLVAAVAALPAPVLADQIIRIGASGGGSGTETVGALTTPEDSNEQLSDPVGIALDSAATQAGTIESCQVYFAGSSSGTIVIGVVTDNGGGSFTDTDRTTALAVADCTSGTAACDQTFDLVALGETLAIAPGQYVAVDIIGADLERANPGGAGFWWLGSSGSLGDSDADSYADQSASGKELQYQCVNAL